MQKRTVYLIRHGQTDHNAEKRWQGWLPTELNDAGHEQAQQLADYWVDRFDGEIFSSDTPRAFQTAQALADAKGKYLYKMEAFREINVGVFQGLTHDEILERYAKEYEEWNQDWGYIVPDGESRLALQTRAYGGLSQIINHSISSEIIVVTHGGVVRSLLEYLFPEQFPPAPFLPNTSVTTLIYYSGDWRLIDVGQTPHLNGN